MKDYNLTIVGAGFSGLIAATQFPNARIVEKGLAPSQNHHALLRFRSDSVGRAVGIPFRNVKVHKGIWSDGKLLDKCNIRCANLYALKVVGEIVDRSIWNLDSVSRFVAPTNFYTLLVDKVGEARIDWGYNWHPGEADDEHNAISTIPMPAIMQMLGMEGESDFRYSSIEVYKAKVSGADIHQTIYYTDPDTNVYRASITGDELMVESTGRVIEKSDLAQVLYSFGIGAKMVSDWSVQDQRYGKIVEINNRARKTIMLNLSMHNHIHSLGRFATWRNILLDDLLQDIDVVKSIMAEGIYNSIIKVKP